MKKKIDCKICVIIEFKGVTSVFIAENCDTNLQAKALKFALKDMNKSGSEPMYITKNKEVSTLKARAEKLCQTVG